MKKIIFKTRNFADSILGIKETVMVCLSFFAATAGLNICQSKFIGNKSFVYAVLWPMRFEIDIE